MKLNLFASTVIAVSSLAILGCETTSEKTGLDRFAEADADRSGLLSRDEVNSYLVTRVFESRDANHNGNLTKSEWVVGEDAAQEKAFRERDADRDGVLTKEEALAYGAKQGAGPKFVRDADTNKDGQLSRDEVSTYYGSKEGPPN